MNTAISYGSKKSDSGTSYGQKPIVYDPTSVKTEVEEQNSSVTVEAAPPAFSSNVEFSSGTLRSEEKMMQLITENEYLRAEIAAHKTATETTHSEGPLVSALRMEIEILKDKSRQTAKTHEERLERERSKIQVLEKKNDELEKERSEQTATKKILAKKVSDLTKEVERLSDDSEARDEKFRECHLALLECRQETEQLKKKDEASTKELAELNDVIERKNKEAAKRRNSSDRDLSIHMKMMKNAIEKNENLERMCEESRQEAENLKEQHAKKKKEMDQQIEDLQKVRDDLEEKTRVSEEKFKKLQEDFRAAATIQANFQQAFQTMMSSIVIPSGPSPPSESPASSNCASTSSQPSTAPTPQNLLGTPSNAPKRRPGRPPKRKTFFVKSAESEKKSKE